jgi:hypothetical protein
MDCIFLSRIQSVANSLSFNGAIRNRDHFPGSFGKTYWHQNEHGRDYGHNHDDYDAAALWREEDEYNEIDYVPSTMETITSTTLTMDLTTTPDTTI